MNDLKQIWRLLAGKSRWKTRHTRRLETALAREYDEAARLRAESGRLHYEIARLRGENRALLNSILGIAGIPPVPVAPADTNVFATSQSSSAEKPRSQPAPASGPEAPATTNPADTDHPRGTPSASGPVSPSNPALAPQTFLFDAAIERRSAKKLAQITAPVRKRSWHQIHRALELEAARQQVQRDAPEA